MAAQTSYYREKIIVLVTGLSLLWGVGCQRMTEAQREANSRPATIDTSGIKEFSFLVDEQEFIGGNHEWNNNESVTFGGHLETEKDQGFNERLNFLTLSFRSKADAPDGVWDLETPEDAASELHLPINQGKVDTSLDPSTLHIDPGDYEVRVYYNTVDIFAGNGKANVILLGEAEVVLSTE